METSAVAWAATVAGSLPYFMKNAHSPCAGVGIDPSGLTQNPSPSVNPNPAGGLQSKGCGFASSQQGRSGCEHSIPPRTSGFAARHLAPGESTTPGKVTCTVGSLNATSSSPSSMSFISPYDETSSNSESDAPPRSTSSADRGPCAPRGPCISPRSCTCNLARTRVPGATSPGISVAMEKISPKHATNKIQRAPRGIAWGCVPTDFFWSPPGIFSKATFFRGVRQNPGSHRFFRKHEINEIDLEIRTVKPNSETTFCKPCWGVCRKVLGTFCTQKSEGPLRRGPK